MLRDVLSSFSFTDNFHGLSFSVNSFVTLATIPMSNSTSDAIRMESYARVCMSNLQRMQNKKDSMVYVSTRNY